MSEVTITTTPLSFSTSQTLKDAWALLKKHWAFLLGLWVSMLLLAFVSGAIQAAIGKNEAGLRLIISLASQVLSLIMEIGFIKIVLKLIRGETAEIKELFSGAGYLIQFVLASLVTCLIELAGFLLLIVPGIIWSLKYMFTLFLVVDDKLQFSDAMAKSAEMTKGIKWKLFGFCWALFGVNLLGCLPLFLGLIVTVPVTSLAVYVLYAHLKEQLPISPALKTAV